MAEFVSLGGDVYLNLDHVVSVYPTPGTEKHQITVVFKGPVDGLHQFWYAGEDKDAILGALALISLEPPNVDHNLSV